jgi:hypothetical protein
MSVDPRIEAAEYWEASHRWMERVQDELTMRSRHCVIQAQRLRDEVRADREARALQENADIELESGMRMLQRRSRKRQAA